MKSLSIVALAIVVGGCSARNFAALSAPSTGNVTLAVSAQVGQGQAVQSLVSAYTPADVDHFDFALETQDASGNWTEIASASTPAGSGTADTVNFSHLEMDTPYEVSVSAITAAGLNITAQGSGQAQFTTTRDDFVPLSVNVVLENKTFDGVAHPLVTVSSGSVVNTTQPVAGVVVANN